jgi:hypothetical protein
MPSDEQSRAVTHTPDLPRTWYAKRSRLAAGIAGVIVQLGCVALALALPASGGWGWESKGGVVVTGTAVMGFLFLLGRPKVTADESGVRVVNLVNSRHFAWPQIVRVYLRQGDPWVFLDLSDGETVPAMGIQVSNGRDQAIKDAGELRDLVEKYGTAAE